MGTLRVLVVEDGSPAMADLPDRLAFMGYEPVGCAAGGERALLLVETQHPDLVLMDIHPRGVMDGVAVAREIRRRFQVPVILLTARSEDETLDRARLVEPFGYLTRPFEDRELRLAIEMTLYRHRVEDEIFRLNRLYAVLSQVNQAIVRIPTREELLPTICRLIVEQGAVELAWIGLLESESRQIKPVAHFGNPGEILSKAGFFVDDRPETQDGPGKAIREGRPFICNDCAHGSCLYPREKAPERFGFKSCGFFPLRFQGEICGALSLCATESRFFREREMELLSEVVQDISFALDKIESDAGRRRAEEEREKLMRLQQGINNLGKSLLAIASLRDKLGTTTETVVRLFDADFCRIWLIEPGDLCDEGCIHAEVKEGPHVCRYRDKCLHLVASSGRYTHTDGQVHRRVPFGCYKIGRVASDEEPKFVTNDVQNDPRVHNHQWARELGLVSFAGYRVSVSGGETLGVLALFAKHPISSHEDALLEGIGSTIGLVIQQARAEQAMTLSERRFRDISEAIGDFLWEMDTRGRFTYVSERVEAVLGYRPEEMKGRAPFELMEEKEVRRLGAWFAEDVQARRGFRDVECRLADKSGRPVWLNVTGIPIIGPAGELLGFRGASLDITQRKRAEEQHALGEAQLRQAQKMEALGTLAGGIAHDFNNILGVILGYAELAKWDAGEGSSLGKSLQEVLKATNRARDLVRQILAFSRRSEQERRPVQVGLIVKEALKMLRASLPTTIEIRQEVTSKTMVMADPTQIHQVLMNLCTNAAHAMREDGGVLWASLTDTRIEQESAPPRSDLQPGAYVKLTVKDTGHGMEPSIMERIFEPFFTTKEPGIGTGLGLAVVHGIVKSYGGSIWVDSLTGRGTTFHVLLPAMESDRGVEAVEVAPLPRGRERVLVVDDEPSLVNAMKEMLERLGYEVACRTNGTEALEAFRHQPREKPFELVITDMTMPHLTGVDLSRELLKIDPRLCIVICTGFSERIDGEKARAIGVRALLMKPVTLRDLAETVRKVLDQRSS